MALVGAFGHSISKGLDSLSDMFKSKKLEKKIKTGQVEIDDLVWLCNYYYIKRDFYKSESFARRVLELDSENSFAKNALFNNYFERSEYSKAIEILENLIKEGDDLSIEYFNLGYCYYKNGTFEKAEEYRLKACEYDSNLKKERYK